MSLIDDQDRAIERLLEGRSRPPAELKELPVTEVEATAWIKLQEEILTQIRSGATFSESWLLNGEWIDIKKGGFSGRSFHLNEPLPEINDRRISEFLKAHAVSVEPTVIQGLRRRLFGMSPADAKSELKLFIISRRTEGRRQHG